jgi:hypothetical protein
VAAEQLKGRAGLLEMVGVLKHQGNRFGEEFAELLGEPGEHERPARYRARIGAHQPQCPFPELRLVAASGRDQREQEDPWITVLGSQPKPEDTVALALQGGGQALGEQVPGGGGDQRVAAPGRTVEDLVLGDGIWATWHCRLRDERHSSPCRPASRSRGDALQVRSGSTRSCTQGSSGSAPLLHSEWIVMSTRFITKICKVP